MKMILSDTKECSKCRDVKCVSAFYTSRTTKDGLQSRCKACTKEGNKQYHKTMYPVNKEAIKKRTKAYYVNNKEAAAAIKSLWYKRNKEAEATKRKEWKLLNKPLLRVYAAKRRSAKLCATPAWLTQKQHDAIMYYYWLANDLEKVTGEKYHVDHIVPLQGTNVCGLHVPWNLQILPAEINISKGNKHT